LWSPDTPKLYTLVSTIVDGTKELDELKTEVGFRWFAFDPNEGFRINGQKLFLKGVSRHQDVWGMGSAVRDGVHRRDLEFIKDMGCNFLRLAHYPQDPEVLAMCDRMGLLVWEEIPIVSHVSSSRRFVETSSTMLREMIRQHYNHPSVIMWGTQNETLLRWQQTLHRFPEYFGMVLGVLKELDALARREDPSRATTLAIHEFGDNYEKAGIAAVPQVLGWNLYAGWYAGEFERFGQILDSQHKRFPERVLFVSEYGAGSDSRLSSERPQRFDHSVEWMAMFHESYLRQSMARPYLAGVAIWNMFDFKPAGDRGDDDPHQPEGHDDLRSSAQGCVFHVPRQLESGADGVPCHARAPAALWDR
jgi:beta-galactosidase